MCHAPSPAAEWPAWHVCAAPLLTRSRPSVARSGPMDDQHSLTREPSARSSYTREWSGLFVKMGHLARDAWARAATAWPRKPDIPRDQLDYLQRWGADAARLMLAGMTAKNPEQAPHYFAQDEVQAWLVRRAKANAFWTRTGAIAAMIAMILAGLSWVMPLKPAASSKPADKPALIDRQFSALKDTLDRLAADVRDLRAEATGMNERIAAANRRLERLEPSPERRASSGQRSTPSR